MIGIVWLAILLPLLGFSYSVAVGWTLAHRGETSERQASTGAVATFAVGLAFVVAIGSLLDLLGRPAESQSVTVPLWDWIVSGDLGVRVSLLVDPLSAMMLMIVTGVGFLIHLYAIGYMRGDSGFARFFAYMNLFIAAMLLLVLADNFLLLMVGWGGVGLCSYLLIAFWHERPDAARAGVKAFVVNSIGDVGLMLAVFTIFTRFGALDYETVLRGANTLDNGAATMIALLLLVGAVAKSAQLPLYTWLPDAMAGPTPVSALIHAATMVTAGVYLIIRAHPIFLQSDFALGLVAAIGAITAIFAATAALVKPNIKRVLAYSTISQLGYMFLGVGVGAFTAGAFHLLTHAFFKALLFLAAGAVIHALSGEEDLRKMGGLRRKLPGVYWTFLIGALALAGFPLLSGFFSKDEIIYAAFNSPHGSVLWGSVALVVTALTAFYIFRAFFLVFHGEPAPDGAHSLLHRPGAVMTWPLYILAALAALAGYIQAPGLGFEHFLAPVFERFGASGVFVSSLDAGYWTLATLSALASFLGIGLAYQQYGKGVVARERLVENQGFAPMLLNDYYIENLYEATVMRPFGAISRFCTEGIDVLVDSVVNGAGKLTQAASAGLSAIQSGFVRNYAMGILLGTVVILAYLVGLGPTSGGMP